MMINVCLLLLGTFMDMSPLILITTPIFLPIVESIGVHPVQFGMIMMLNLGIGLITPPIGSVLFVGCSVGKTNIAKVIPPLLPMYAAMFVVLMIVTYIPGVSEWLPTVAGLYNQ